MTEREKLQRLKELREKRKQLENYLDSVKTEYSKIETDLIESLMTAGKEATARYEDLGYCVLMQPKVRASVKKEDEEKLKSYLMVKDRSDMIKETVHPQTLSAYVKTEIEEGNEIPSFISYFLQPQMRLYV